ncbi:glycosyltransferase family 2 protein [Actibacterium ureilyticum]|uniref:glycosyltransferase family 2 protein n=1 Tax=Actibacterium ureilyticum TaxID=1590614 RepID=UPI000BAA9EDC|nr:glycosyltransferase family 2 protein [Actibacterium ureilyticum]
MTEIWLHIGLPYCGAERIQQVLAARRGALKRMGVLFATTPGRRNHTRLFLAASDPDMVGQLRAQRGFAEPDKQAALRAEVQQALTDEIAAAQPQTVILSAQQLAIDLHRDSELARLHDMLAPLASRIRVLAHLDNPARMLAAHYAEQIRDGRTAPLDRDLALLAAPDWSTAALADWTPGDVLRHQSPDVQAPPPWLDYAALQSRWERAFGAGNVQLRSYSAARFADTALPDEIAESFALPGTLNPVELAPDPAPLSDATLERGRLLNAQLIRLLATGRSVPRRMWRRFLDEVAVPGAPLDPGALAVVSDRFAQANAALADAHPGLNAETFNAPDPKPAWTPPDPQMGYRATQYLAAFLPRIDRATREEQRATKSARTPELSPAAQAILPDTARAKLDELRRSPFAPHNLLGGIDETQAGPDFTTPTPRSLPEGRSGNVVVACMKNEGPYILEWVAYHRLVGFDTFLIYTNDCTDGTDQILQRLQAMGILHHRSNNGWKGKSPQQYALNQSLREPVMQQADWIAHFDVDEFVNIRCGNGTLDDFFAHCPDATHVAMTWRLFGTNGVTEFRDAPVIGQFDHCAPKYCPKPHTAWGFKTLSRNIGAYEKLSCHRPNKLQADMRDRVRWVNGSARAMGDTVVENGWRSSKRTIGYDLLQLNHYALRSADSFLVKRQRGRALHVDRTIGMNYWIRMDWNDHRDVTIQRNLPRLRAEIARLKQDAELAALHQAAVDWHRAKAAELRADPEFADLLRSIRGADLTATERAAFALSLDMES